MEGPAEEGLAAEAEDLEAVVVLEAADLAGAVVVRAAQWLSADGEGSTSIIRMDRFITGLGIRRSMPHRMRWLASHRPILLMCGIVLAEVLAGR